MNLSQDERRVLLDAIRSYHAKLERQLLEDMAEGSIQADVVEGDLALIDELHDRVNSGDL